MSQIALALRVPVPIAVHLHLHRLYKICVCIFAIILVMTLVIATPVHAILYGGGDGVMGISSGTDASKIIGDDVNDDVVLDTSPTPTPPASTTPSRAYTFSKSFIPLGFIICIFFAIVAVLVKQRVHPIFAVIVAGILVYLAMPLVNLVVEFFSTVW